MNAIVPVQIHTMSSREIADLTVKRHPDVKRDCDVMFKELNLDVSKFAHIYLDTMNRKQSEYLLPRDLVETLITGYSIKLRHAVLNRLRELEEAVKQKMLSLYQTFPILLKQHELGQMKWKQSKSHSKNETKQLLRLMCCNPKHKRWKCYLKIEMVICALPMLRNIFM